MGDQGAVQPGNIIDRFEGSAGTSERQVHEVRGQQDRPVLKTMLNGSGMTALSAETLSDHFFPAPDLAEILLSPFGCLGVAEAQDGFISAGAENIRGPMLAVD